MYFNNNKKIYVQSVLKKYKKKKVNKYVQDYDSRIIKPLESEIIQPLEIKTFSSNKNKFKKPFKQESSFFKSTNKTKELINKYKSKKDNEIYENEKGFKIPIKYKKQIDEYINKINKNNQARFNDIKDKKIKVNGIETGWTFQDRVNAEKIRMGEVYSTRYGAFKVPVKSAIENISDKQQLLNYIKNLKYRSSKRTIEKQMNQYKENYISSIRNNYKKSKNTEKLIKKIDSMSAKEIDKMMLEDDRVYIRFNYTKQEEMERLKDVMDAFGLNYE